MIGGDGFYCDRCEKYHRDGDKVEVRSDGWGISVVCRRHTLWANRHAIRALLRSWKLVGLDKGSRRD